MRTMTLRNSLLLAVHLAALVHSVRGDACATRHWNEGENAFWACMGQWARDSDAIFILPQRERLSRFRPEKENPERNFG